MLWLIILILVIAQVVSAWHLIKLWNQGSDESKWRMSSLINQSEERRYRYPIIDITENRVYIPEARIYLPLNDVSRNLRYDYISLKNQEHLHLSTLGIVGRQTDHDPASCDKVVSIIKPSDANKYKLYSLVGTIQPTKDGLSEIIVHNACRIYPDNLRESLATIAKEIRSY
jgi:hypothetical protein